MKDMVSVWYILLKRNFGSSEASFFFSFKKWIKNIPSDESIKVLVSKIPN